MATRMRYPEVAPEGYAALQAFGHYVNTATALEPVLLGMVYLRASVLNGCGFCTEAHKAELRKHNEPEGRIEAVVEGPGSDVFTPRERAALVWTEALTKLKDGPASDAEYAAVSVFFQGKTLVDLTFAVANINAWNRMGVAFRPEWRPRAGAAAKASAAPVATQDPVRREAEPEDARGLPVAEAPATDASAPHASADDDGGKVATD